MKHDLQKLLETPFETPVYYFAATQREVLMEAARAVRDAFEKTGQADFTRVDGPTPDLGEVIAAAGAISFFGTQRVVQLVEIAPSGMGDKDVDELAALFGEVENAVLVVTALYKDKRGATSKKAKKLLEQAEKFGFATQLEKPDRRENLQWIQECAAGYQTAFAPGAAETLLERAGDNRVLLRTETEKLAAISGYGSITKAEVEKYGAVNIEADVFGLARMITAGNTGAAFARLGELLEQKHEAIGIAAALAGTFVDMLRVRVGSEKGLAVPVIFKEMGYTGNDYRLKKAKENAARYTTPALEKSVLCLAGLDKALKSSALPNKSILLEVAVGKLIQLGARA